MMILSLISRPFGEAFRPCQTSTPKPIMTMIVARMNGKVCANPSSNLVRPGMVMSKSKKTFSKWGMT